VHDDRLYRVNRPRVIFENIDGELILVNLEKGCYFSTDAFGADIWELIESGHTVHGIREALGFRYEGDSEEIHRVATAFIEKLIGEELVVLVEDAERAEVPTPATHSRRTTFRMPELQKYTDMRDMLLLDPVHDVEAAGWPVPKAEEAWPSAERES